jgi:hypothetical protein
MAPGLRFFLALAFVALSSPARAQVVTLLCQNTNPQSYTGDSSTLRVDYGRKTVELLRSDGTAAYSAGATITEGAVEWTAVLDKPRGGIFSGSLNRLSGQLSGQHTFVAADGRILDNILSGPCRRATQKF